MVVLLREALRHIAVDHQADDLLGVQLLGRTRGDPLAVAHDGDVVGDAQNLVHLVGDVDDAHAPGRQLFNDLKEVLDLVFCQRGSRLIEHDDLGVVGNRLGDLDHLPLRNGEVADDPLGIDVDIERFKDLLGLVVHALAVYQRAVHGEAAQPDVFHDAAAQHLVQFLMHHGHAIVQRVAGVDEVDFLAFHEDGAGVLLVNAEQAFHQRGLACAILAHEGVHGAGAELELRVVQRLDARKLLADVFHLKEIGLILLHSIHRSSQSMRPGGPFLSGCGARPRPERNGPSHFNKT